jgi:hypothetical protein
MNELKYEMISEATQNFATIYPCGNKKTLEDCFTMNGDQLLFWFNTEDQSTHIITKPLDNVSAF